MRYRTSTPQELADIIIHAKAYNLPVLNIQNFSGNFVIEIDGEFPEAENKALRLYDQNQNKYLSPIIAAEMKR